ncbi:cyclase family protein [Paraglaciecola sp. Hal342]
MSIPKSKWQLISVEDLEPSAKYLKEDDIVLINTGWHQRYADSQEYFGHSQVYPKKLHSG